MIFGCHCKVFLCMFVGESIRISGQCQNSGMHFQHRARSQLLAKRKQRPCPLLRIPRERSWCLPPLGALPNLRRCTLPSHFCPLPPRDLRLCGALPPSHTGVHRHLHGTLLPNLRPLILGDHLHGMLLHCAGVHCRLHGTLRQRGLALLGCAASSFKSLGAST